MNLDYEALEIITYKLLANGVPPAVVARVFDMNRDTIRGCLKEVRVHRYGTDDIGDYVEQLKWDALARGKYIIENGLPAEQTRFAAAVLGKTIALQARRTPEKQAETVEQIQRMFAQMAGGPPKQTEGANPRFLAYADDTTEATDDEDV